MLLTVVQNLRKRIISLGGEVRFNTQVTGLCTENGHLTGLKIADGPSATGGAGHRTQRTGYL